MDDPGTDPSGRPRILHVSADFPDPVAPEKTRAIANLLTLTQDRFAHRVVSLNRRSPRGLAGYLPRARGDGIEAQPFAWGECLVYEAPGRGLFHRGHLLRLAEAIAARMRAGPLPDLVVGHKLTVEGIVAEHIAQLTGVPYAITIQGNTDTKVLAARPDLAPRLRAVLAGARGVTAFAPWALAAVEARLGKREGPVALIPCSTELDTPLVPREGGNGLLSVFHLHGHTNKNLAGMAAALRILARRGAPQRLAICGGGSAADTAAARRSAGDAPGLIFEGPLERGAVPGRMNAASAFVMPSHRETFGLVFIEALFAGLPIIYPAGKAVAGYFDGCPFAIPVPSRDTEALAEAMARAVREEARLKAALADWHASGEAERFRRSAIARDYGDALAAAIAGPRAASADRSAA